jgi:hypothetical protein
MRSKKENLNHEQNNLIFVQASSLRPRLTKDGKTLLLFLGSGKGAATICLSLAYLEAIKKANMKRSA